MLHSKGKETCDEGAALLEAVHDILSFALTPRTAAAATKHIKDVSHAAPATATVCHPLPDGVLAVLVIYLPLFRIL
jgi:hypothetical protein